MNAHDQTLSSLMRRQQRPTLQQLAFRGAMALACLLALLVLR